MRVHPRRCITHNIWQKTAIQSRIFGRSASRAALFLIASTIRSVPSTGFRFPRDPWKYASITGALMRWRSESSIAVPYQDVHDSAPMN